MFRRIHAASSLAFVLSFIVFTAAFAKGGFDFIAVAGADLDEAVRITDVALTEDFFTFANFYEDKTEAPVDPGQGFEITRHYIDGARDIIFDRLHYYPETGLVFYDGIENGESEYDGEWYVAQPEIKIVFESALVAQMASASSVEEQLPVASVPQPQADQPITPLQPVRGKFSSLPVTIVLLATGLTALLLFAVWRQKASPR
jgi:hypothetical protein